MSETPAKETQHEKKGFKALRIILKIVAFLLILVLLIHPVSVCLSSNYTSRIHEFYKEDEDSLDAVFIGSSTTHAFWSPLYAWKNHGIATYNFSADAQTVMTVRYMVEEAVKYQPNAVIVITLTSPNVLPREEYFHSLTDAMPLSLTKLRLIHDYCEQKELAVADRLEYYFTLYRYHSRWDSLKLSDFEKTESEVPKAPNITSTYRTKTTDASGAYPETDECAELSEDILASLGELLDYCEETGVSVLFLEAPRPGSTESGIAKMNAVFAVIESRGFPVLKMQSRIDEIGLDLAHDFYDKNHTNIHGSLKYTEYVAEHLISRYGLKDRRGDPEYADFDEAYDAYTEYTDPYLFPFENGETSRDYSLPPAGGVTVEYVAEDNSAAVSWELLQQDVDGYAVFRKCPEGYNCWKEVGTVDASGCSFVSENLVNGKTYYFSIVPYTEKDGTRFYGNADYQGVKVAVPKS